MAMESGLRKVSNEGSCGRPLSKTWKSIALKPGISFPSLEVINVGILTSRTGTRIVVAGGRDWPDSTKMPSEKALMESLFIWAYPVTGSGGLVLLHNRGRREHIVIGVEQHVLRLLGQADLELVRSLIPNQRH